MRDTIFNKKNLQELHLGGRIERISDWRADDSNRITRAIRYLWSIFVIKSCELRAFGCKFLTNTSKCCKKRKHFIILESDPLTSAKIMGRYFRVVSL